MRKSLSFALVALLMLSSALAQNKAGTTVAQFLKLGVGSRAAGMGEAFVATSDDVSGLYWNPAGIAGTRGPQIMFQHNDWVSDISNDFIGVISPLGGFGVVGVSMTSLSMGEMAVTTEEEPEGTGEMFSASDMALGLTYARALTDRFSIGFNFKYIQEKIWHMSANGIAMDVGTLFRTQFHDMRLGMSISNYGSNMQLSGRDGLIYYDPATELEGNNPAIPAVYKLDTWPLPLLFRVGVAFDAYETDFMKLTVALDALHPNDNYESVNIGAELAVANWVFLRAGWKSPFVETNTRVEATEWDRREESLSFGGGVDMLLFGSGAGLKVDYAFSDFGRLQDVHRFTLGLYF